MRVLKLKLHMHRLWRKLTDRLAGLPDFLLDTDDDDDDEEEANLYLHLYARVQSRA